MATTTQRSTPVPTVPADPEAPPSLGASRGAIDVPTITLWLAIQVGCLAVAFLHVPLAAVYPPGERLAVEMLAAVQIGSAALLASALARSAATAAVAAASAWPALLLAGALQVRSLAGGIGAAAVVTAWIVALTVWVSAFRSPAARAVVAASGVLLGVGGSLAAYLVAEFGSPFEPQAVTSATSDWPGALSMTPTALAWRAAEGDRIGAWNALPMAGLLVSGLVFWAWRRHRRRHSVPLRDGAEDLNAERSVSSQIP
jgi:hypothetical protein